MWRSLPIDERSLRISGEGYPNAQHIGFVSADAIRPTHSLSAVCVGRAGSVWVNGLVVTKVSQSLGAHTQPLRSGTFIHHHPSPPLPFQMSRGRHGSNTRIPLIPRAINIRRSVPVISLKSLHWSQDQKTKARPSHRHKRAELRAPYLRAPHNTVQLLSSQPESHRVKTNR